LGVLGSACIGGEVGLYEPVHGSAPDIAGKDLANPIGVLVSTSMMLRHSFGLHTEADAIDRAISQVLADGLRTADTASPGESSLGTRAFTDAIVEALS
jgi:3-isopropylmalate dehydrogenase